MCGGVFCIFFLFFFLSFFLCFFCFFFPVILYFFCYSFCPLPVNFVSSFFLFSSQKNGSVDPGNKFCFYVVE